MLAKFPHYTVINTQYSGVCHSVAYTWLVIQVSIAVVKDFLHSYRTFLYSVCCYVTTTCASLQDKSYNFEEVPALHESLIKFNFLDTDVLYDVSLQREPR